MRVYELASRLGLSNKQMIEILWENHIDVKNHMSKVDQNIIKKIMKVINSRVDLISNENSSSLKYIHIRGLFNKYDYEINFDNKINIFIAENGFGKTTILNIIVAILKQDIKRLKNLQFKSIELGIGDTLIEISKDELNNNYFSKEHIRYLLMKSRRYIPIKDYLRLRDQFIQYNKMDLDELRYLIEKYSYDRDFYRDLSEIGNKYQENTTSLNEKFKIIKNKLKEEILYFPTYRRIEEELDNFIELSKEEKERFKSKIDSSTINFGMEDVEIIIKDLTDKLKEDAINHYSIMNGEILDDLLSNKVELSRKDKNKIDMDKIKIVVGRIGKDRIKQLDKLMSFIEKDSNVENVENKKFLEYYLFKLISIYEGQKLIDEKIKKYKDVCNKYLVNKEIVYDEVIAEVKIVDSENGEELNFNELSSGEKQILSIFARLYLNTSKPVIFIIDEPELSLSILWQKRLLKDIYDSGSIALLIATTHSPFIFQNDFRTYAKELRIFRVDGDVHE